MADGPEFGRQTLVWAWTLIDLGQVTPDRLVVWSLSPPASPERQALHRLGIETRSIQPFAPGFPHCNKLQQLLDDRFTGNAVTIFTDTDMAFVKPIDDLAQGSNIVAKVVDLPHPPLDMWRQILETAGLPSPDRLMPTSLGQHTTPIINRNGGLYVLPGTAIAALREPWPRWAHWLMRRPDLLPGGYGVHVDQISFGMAVLERHLAIDDLPLAANCPTHVPGLVPDVSPRVLHYHRSVDRDGFLLPVGRPGIDAAILTVNEVIRRRQSGGAR